MKIRRILSALVTFALCGAAGFAGYSTREKWMPVVFPEKKTESAAEEAHDHSCCTERANTEHTAVSDRVKLSAQAQKNLKLDVDTLAPEPYWRTLLIPGTVVDRPGESDRGVTARAAGVVTAIHAKPGDTFKAGDVLFELQLVSEVVQSTQIELAKAARELTIATEKRDRTAERVKEKLLPMESLLEDEGAVKRFTTLVSGLRRQLQSLGLSPTQIDKAATGDFTTQVTVLAPTPGDKSQTVFEVQELKVTLGETVQAGQTLAVLASHQKLFVEGRAFKSEATALAKLAELKTPIKAEFADESPGEWPEPPALTIRHLSNMVDPATRTFAFYLPLDNQPRSFEQDGRTHLVWRYRPGQRVRLRVPIEKVGDEVLVLPASGIVHEGGEAFAFVQNGDLFVRKPVRVLFEDRRDAVLANDGSLPAGTFVVRNQAAALNRALKSAGAGGGHEGHDHAGHSH